METSAKSGSGFYKMSEFIIGWKWIWPNYRIYPRLHSTAFYDQIIGYELIAIIKFPLPLATLFPPSWIQLHLPPIHLIVPTTHWSSTSHWSDDPLVCSSQVLWPIGSISHWSYLLYILSYIPLVPCSTSPTTYSPYAPIARGLIGPRDWTPCDTWPIGPTKYWPYNPIVWWFIGPTNRSQYVVQDQWLVCALDQWSNAQTSHWSCELLFLCSMGSMNWSQDDRHSTSFACADYEIIRILFLSNMFLSTK